MFTIIIRAIEFCVYHLCIVIASRISKIQVQENARYQDQLLRRYLAAMTEVRMLKGEMIKLKGRQYSPSLKVRCAHALSYIFTYNDKIYHDTYLSTKKATARNWAYKFRHPLKSRKRKNLGGRMKITDEIREMIINLKKENMHWGAKRIRDELLKMGINVSKNSITNVLKKHGLYPTDGGSSWEVWKGKFRDHIWAADFFFVETVKELSCMVFILIDIYTKEILSLKVHEGRKNISSFWVAGKIAKVFHEQKRQPEKLIHDRDPLFLGQVTRLCAVAGIKELRMPPKIPNMNAFVERNIQSIRLEMTDHIRARDGTELQKLLDEYKIWFNNHRPHQGIGGLRPKAFSEDKKHPEPISMEEIRGKKLKKSTFAKGLLTSFELVEDLKKAA